MKGDEQKDHAQIVSEVMDALTDQEDRAYRLRQRLQDILSVLKDMGEKIDNEISDIDEVLRRTK